MDLHGLSIEQLPECILRTTEDLQASLDRFDKAFNIVEPNNPDSWATPELLLARTLLTDELERRQSAPLNVLKDKLCTKFEATKIKLNQTKDIWAK